MTSCVVVDNAVFVKRYLRNYIRSCSWNFACRYSTRLLQWAIEAVLRTKVS